jgi:toxin ParE1/3/4
MSNKKAVRFTQLAINDLNHIWDYTFEKWGINQSEKYTQEIRKSFLDIEKKMFKELTKGKLSYKTYTIGRHRIIIKESHNEFLIIRILHQSMDTKRHL